MKTSKKENTSKTMHCKFLLQLHIQGMNVIFPTQTNLFIQTKQEMQDESQERKFICKTVLPQY